MGVDGYIMRRQCLIGVDGVYYEEAMLRHVYIYELKSTNHLDGWGIGPIIWDKAKPPMRFLNYAPIPHRPRIPRIATN